MYEEASAHAAAGPHDAGSVLDRSRRLAHHPPNGLVADFMAVPCAMRVLTEDGKLFGRINVIDLAGALLLIFAVSALVVVKLLPNRPLRAVERMDKEEASVVKVVLPRDTTWLAERIAIGDAVTDEAGIKVRVVGIERVILGGTPSVVVSFWLRSRRRSSGGLAFGTANVRVGETLAIVTDRYTVTAPIYDIVRSEP